MAKRVRGGPTEDPALLRLIRAILTNDAPVVTASIGADPDLVRKGLVTGASRQGARNFFFEDIAHYLIAGDTPLHAAAAGHRREIAENLIRNSADVAARNRRGAMPLHYAADGGPASTVWNSRAQAETIACLIDAGADPNALDASGVAPLHRAVRQRCADAVDTLLRRGAEVRLQNKSGSTPLHLAVQNTGRGGTGAPDAKTLQRTIIQLLLAAGADPTDRDGGGKTVRQCTQIDWICELL